VAEIKPDVTLDCFGLTCPMPIFNASQKMKELAVGQVLEVIATDEGIVADMPEWCKRTGNEFIGSTEEDGEYRVYVRKLVD
jgi:tRNA 2-thiouridine synthesizing protein A